MQFICQNVKVSVYISIETLGENRPFFIVCIRQQEIQIQEVINHPSPHLLKIEILKKEAELKRFGKFSAYLCCKTLEN